jgi:hypothetical protein
MMATHPTALKLTSGDHVKVSSARSISIDQVRPLPRQLPAILIVSTIPVLVNCYPIVFRGEVTFSPASVVSLVYDWWPPAPELGQKRFLYPGMGVTPEP